MPTSGRALVISAWLTGVYFLVELAVGLWTGSIAVLERTCRATSPFLREGNGQPYPRRRNRRCVPIWNKARDDG